MSELLEGAKSKTPHWAGETIEAWDEVEFQHLERFATAVYWTDQGSVNVFRVVGTQQEILLDRAATEAKLRELSAPPRRRWFLAWGG